jgi:glycosyltransferase involved in cell wall biosynthesis
MVFHWAESMNVSPYPNRHHPVYFLEDALRELGADVHFHRNEKTRGCWGLEVNGKVMVWLLDNRWPHEREKVDPATRQLLAEGVLVCHTQKPDAERIGGQWLPLAVTPGYYPKKMPQLFDVGFVGYVRDDARLTLLNTLASRYSTNYASGLFGENALDTYCQSRVAINIPSQYGHPAAYDVNMRVFECLATGVPLVTNYLDTLAELGIEDGKTMFAYGSPDGIIDAVQRAIDRPEVGQTGAALAQERHTYTHRAKQVLEWLG